MNPFAMELCEERDMEIEGLKRQLEVAKNYFQEEKRVSEFKIERLDKFIDKAERALKNDSEIIDIIFMFIIMLFFLIAGFAIGFGGHDDFLKTYKEFYKIEAKS